MYFVLVSFFIFYLTYFYRKWAATAVVKMTSDQGILHSSMKCHQIKKCFSQDYFFLLKAVQNTIEP